jgi:hypothetical protein
MLLMSVLIVFIVWSFKKHQDREHEKEANRMNHYGQREEGKI